MKALKPTKSRCEHIERVLRRCALELHPSGDLVHLASAMACSPKSLGYWIKHGRVPPRKAKWLEERFSVKIADAMVLSTRNQSLLR